MDAFSNSSVRAHALLNRISDPLTPPPDSDKIELRVFKPQALVREGPQALLETRVLCTNRIWPMSP